MQSEPCPSMEAVFEQGGFRFKETVATEDPLEKSGELRKVLALMWNTESDEIFVDMNVNYGRIYWAQH